MFKTARQVGQSLGCGWTVAVTTGTLLLLLLKFSAKVGSG